MRRHVFLLPARSATPCAPRIVCGIDRSTLRAQHVLARRASGVVTPWARGCAQAPAHPLMRRRAPAARVVRVSTEPVVAAGSVDGYGPIFNAGVIVHDGCYHLFARAVRNGYRTNPDAGPGQPRFLDYVSDLLVFVSNDGLDYRFRKVLLASVPGTVYEDPRIQQIVSGGRPHFLLTYTNVPARETGETWRGGIAELTYRDGDWSVAGHHPAVGPEGVPNKDVVLCNLAGGRIGLIQRLERDTWPQQTIQIAIFDTLEALWGTTAAYWQHFMDTLPERTIISPRPGANGVGGGAPPLLVDGELVFFYHERDHANVYMTRVALLDRRTGRVRALLDEPILAPELPWELAGDVGSVIFVEGAQLREDGTIYLTYGASDRHVGAATIKAGPLIAALRSIAAT